VAVAEEAQGFRHDGKRLMLRVSKLLEAVASREHRSQ
jgi:hypothetical protein